MLKGKKIYLMDIKVESLIVKGKNSLIFSESLQKIHYGENNPNREKFAVYLLSEMERYLMKKPVDK